MIRRTGGAIGATEIAAAGLTEAQAGTERSGKGTGQDPGPGSADIGTTAAGMNHPDGRGPLRLLSESEGLILLGHHYNIESRKLSMNSIGFKAHHKVLLLNGLQLMLDDLVISPDVQSGCSIMHCQASS